MSSLFEWFKSRNEESAINKTLIHTQKVLECVVEFEKGLSFFIEEKNIDLALKVFFTFMVPATGKIVVAINSVITKIPINFSFIFFLYLHQLK